MRVIIIHNRILSDSSPDETDVLNQLDLVRTSLIQLGHKVEVMDIGEEIYQDIQKISKKNPDLVFNLVESVFDHNELLYLVPALLKAFHISYTGASVEALFQTTNKAMAKKQMRRSGIPTPEWFDIDEYSRLKMNQKYILKPLREDGSVDLDEEAIFLPGDPLLTERILALDPSSFFIEKYVDGKEFNISLLTQSGRPEVLPAAEMIFHDYPPDKERIIGYKAKWDPDSFEYQHTLRKFHIYEKSNELITKMHNIALQCWEVFDLKGYARVDFRVDLNNNPYVLEINANPCISPDSGFIAAAREAGYGPEDVIEKLLNDVN
jgi:D-alanine-D-alanine ligase